MRYAGARSSLAMHPVRRAMMMIAVMSVAATCDGSTGPRNAVPVVTALQPDHVEVGSGRMHVTVVGSGFVRGSVIRWDGVQRPTTFVSDTALVATLHPEHLEIAGDFEVSVFSPEPGGGASGSLAFTVMPREVVAGEPVAPLPVLTAVSPATRAAGSGAFTLTVAGQGFHERSVVRWNGFPRATTYVSATQLTAQILASDLTLGARREVRVETPAPGGGLSARQFVEVTWPAPVLTSLSPSRIRAAPVAAQVELTGTGFTIASAARINGTTVPTIFRSATLLEAQVPAAVLDVPGSIVEVSVHTREPGGGTSSPLDLHVDNGTPVIAEVNPAVVTEASGPVTVTVTGSLFAEGAVVEVNGIARPTTFVAAHALRAELDAADVASRGDLQLVVVNPEPGGGPSQPWTFVVAPASVSLLDQQIIELPTADIIADPVRDRIYVTVLATHPDRGNSVTVIDATTGGIVSSIAVGTNPDRMAISADGAFLYVGVNGNGTVRRIDLETLTAEPGFPVLQGSPTVLAGDMEVPEGSPRTLVISRRVPNVSPQHAGVAVYDDGVMRSVTTGGHTGSDVITLSDIPNRLYGYNNWTTEFGFRKLEIRPNGMVETSVLGGLLNSFSIDIEYGGGRVYSTNGVVLDPEIGRVVGTIESGGLVRPEAARARVYYLNGTILAAYHWSVLVPLGSIGVPAGGSGRLVRWGDDGFAWRNDTQVVIIRSDLVGGAPQP